MLTDATRYVAFMPTFQIMQRQNVPISTRTRMYHDPYPRCCFAQRDANVTLSFHWNTMPHSGMMFFSKKGSQSVTFPAKYIDGHTPKLY